MFKISSQVCFVIFSIALIFFNVGALSRHSYDGNIHHFEQKKAQCESQLITIFEKAISSESLPEIKEVCARYPWFDFFQHLEVFHFVAASQRGDMIPFFLDELAARCPDYKKDPARILVENCNGVSPLDEAICNGQMLFVRYLVERFNLLPPAAGQRRIESLQKAAARGTRDTISYFVEHLKIDPRVPTVQGKSLLHLAAEKQCDPEIFSYLIDRCKLSPMQEVERPQGRDIPLMNAAKNDNLLGVCTLLHYQPLISLRYAQLQNLMRYAARASSCEVLVHLIEQHKVSFNFTVAEHHGTLLHDAAASGSLKNVRLLCERYNLKVDHHSTLGTPLVCAAVNGHTQVAEYLIGKGADITVRHQGDSLAHLGIAHPLFIAWIAANYPLLLEIENSHCKRPLEVAFDKGCSATRDYLMRWHAQRPKKKVQEQIENDDAFELKPFTLIPTGGQMRLWPKPRELLPETAPLLVRQYPQARFHGCCASM